MSLNWAMLNPNRSPVPLRNEMTVTTIDSGVDIALTIPDVPPSSSSNGGGFGGVRRLNEVGKIYLTDQRVCTPFSDLYNHADTLNAWRLSFKLVLVHICIGLQWTFRFTIRSITVHLVDQI
jgi:hypothetical protein